MRRLWRLLSAGRVKAHRTDTDNPSYLVNLLRSAGHCRQFGAASLKLLAAIMRDQLWGWDEIGLCLNEIADGDSALANDPQFRRLREQVQLRGG